MIDADLRLLERKLAENPGDPSVSLALDRARARAGILYTLPPIERLRVVAPFFSLRVVSAESNPVLPPVDLDTVEVRPREIRAQWTTQTAAGFTSEFLGRTEEERERLERYLKLVIQCDPINRYIAAHERLNAFWYETQTTTPGPGPYSAWLAEVGPQSYAAAAPVTSAVHHVSGSREGSPFTGAALEHFRRYCLRIARGESRLKHADDRGWSPDD